MDAAVVVMDLGVDGAVPAVAGDGQVLGELYSIRLDWACADGRLVTQLLLPEAVEPPVAEGSEPVASALARLVQWATAHGAVLALGNPAEALGPERVALAQGVRLFGIASDADEACWDAALSVGLPIYALRGELRCDLSGSRRRDVGAVLLALAYGLYTCGMGLQPEHLAEDRAGVAWRFAREDVTASVIVRGGFEAARISGAEGAWQDRGTEGYVRIAFSAGAARCWSQPRLVVPRG